MNKLSIFFLSFLLSWASLLGQERDIRARLEIAGGLSEISVSPDGNFWLSSSGGKLYTAKGITDMWTYADPLPSIQREFAWDTDRLDRLTFFNKDIAIITGRIAAEDDHLDDRGYFHTINGGKTWTRLDFPGDTWIQDVYANPQGHAWMGGRSGHIFYSCDFGGTWTQLNSPYQRSDQLRSIYMQDEQHGIAAGPGDKIYLTRDNWTSYRRIETPMSQYKFPTKGLNPHFPIEKARIWKEWIIVKQNNQSFYSRTDDIDWQVFSEGLIDFELNSLNSSLIAINKDWQILQLNSPEDIQVIHQGRLQAAPLNLKVMYNQVFVIDRAYGIYQINKDQFIHRALYTLDHSIPTPRHIARGNPFYVGVDQNHLYLSDDQGESWFREAVLPFEAEGIFLLDQENVVLWDGKDNHLYNLDCKESETFQYKSPLSSFLKTPVTSLSIESGSAGCFHHNTSQLLFEMQGPDRHLVLSTYLHDSQVAEEHTSIKQSINPADVSILLQQINFDPSYMPKVEDFQIQVDDINLFGKEIRKRNEEGWYGESLKQHFLLHRHMYLLTDSLLEAVLRREENMISTTSGWFKLQFVNANQDTLSLSHVHSSYPSPFLLPMIATYQGRQFSCYLPQLARFIEENLPDDFPSKEQFSNVQLLMDTGFYLHQHSK